MSEQVTKVVEDFVKNYGKKFQKHAAKIIADALGTAKAVATPTITTYADKAAYVWEYNKTHGKQARPSQDEVDMFGSPAFAVLGAVHVFSGAPDWLASGKPNVRKINSTLVHEAIHANSHQGTGLQEEDTTKFHGPGSFCYMDEVITDLFGYATYVKMGLATDGNYESGYVVPKGKNTVGVPDGAWISLAFVLPAFDGKRRQILAAYFSGGNLNGVDIDLQKYLKVLGNITNDQAKGYGIPASLRDERNAIGAKVVDNELLPLCVIKKSALPIAHCDKLLELASA